MNHQTLPREFPEWRENSFDRAEDAAYAFGRYLILHCRDEALSSIPEDAATEARALAEEAVDTALHNVCALLEGFWPLKVGPHHKIALALGVQVLDTNNKAVEAVEISPCKLDLPIGYWKWAKDREFR